MTYTKVSHPTKIPTLELFLLFFIAFSDLHLRQPTLLAEGEILGFGRDFEGVGKGLWVSAGWINQRTKTSSDIFHMLSMLASNRVAYVARLLGWFSHISFIRGKIGNKVHLLCPRPFFDWVGGREGGGFKLGYWVTSLGRPIFL